MNKVRIAIGAISLSAAAFVGLLSHEGYSEKAYPDPTYGTKVPTVGFGTTEGVKMGDTTDPVRAVQRALQDASKYEGAIKRCVTAPLHQAEYDLYTNLAYNIGPGAFCSSTIVRRLNEQRYAEACDAILLFRYSNKQDCSAPGNRTCSGLWKRRLETHAACMEAQR